MVQLFLRHNPDDTHTLVLYDLPLFTGTRQECSDEALRLSDLLADAAKIHQTEKEPPV